MPDWNPDDPMDDGNPLGEPESAITWQVDVVAYLDQRRASMEAHRSQATDIEEFLGMPEDVFALAFGTEHYIEPGVGGPMRRGWPFAAQAVVSADLPSAERPASRRATGTRNGEQET